MYVLYFPVLFYWFYLSLKAKSLFFFSMANPLRKHAGFALEKKSEVYVHLPKAYYPKTMVVEGGLAAAHLKIKLDEAGFYFPLMVKPDMGERGANVKLINNLPDLVSYSAASRVDFLVQAYVDYPLEIGIFYYRIPGELVGKISGIVFKEFLTVTGDGKSTIKELLKLQDRYLLQLAALEKMQSIDLNKVLAINEQRLLVPYGNHCRGAKFIDASAKINNQLITVIDSLCQQIPEFYFGRLDIKFNSWEELYEGKCFSIIEVNGAASEPTHMYDPAHSVFFAWKEIMKHWNLLYKISWSNATEKKSKLMGISDGIRMIKDHRNHLKKLVGQA